MNARRILGTLAFALAALAGVTFGAAPAGADVGSRRVAPVETFNVGMLRVERFGVPRGVPLIFIPALYCGSWQWNREIAALAPSHDVYALTLPGFDGRPRDRGTDLMNRAAADLSALIRTRRLKHPIVIGHSLGGTLAVLFAETYPQQPGAIVAVEGGYPVAATQAQRDRIAAAASKPYYGVDEVTFSKGLRTNQLQYVITSKSDVDTVSRYADRSDPTAVALWLRAALSLNLTPGLHDIRVPFTEIVPFSEAIDPYNGFATFRAKRSAYEAWIAHAPNGRLIMIDDSRHFVMFDQPAVFDAALFATIGWPHA
jgi:pimeloyl-ACP methyl ester carboxylesterase